MKTFNELLSDGTQVADAELITRLLNFAHMESVQDLEAIANDLENGKGSRETMVRQIRAVLAVLDGKTP